MDMERERIIKLFQDLYNGHPWLDVSILRKLQSLSATKAATKILPGWNSVWEIVNHLTSWRLEVLKRVQGNITISPENNYFAPVQDTSEAAWREALSRLEESQQLWVAFLKEFNEEELARVYPDNNFTYYEHIHGILQHDAYHLGQISLLVKENNTSSDVGTEREEF